jgi:hypothetical protein
LIDEAQKKDENIKDALREEKSIFRVNASIFRVTLGRAAIGSVQEKYISM